MPVFDVYDDKEPRRIVIDEKRITIGRTEDNGVVINDRQSSRKHCEVRLSEIGYVVNDLKSRNGTLLNQQFRCQTAFDTEKLTENLRSEIQKVAHENPICNHRER